jgi:hypothetical protein
MATNITVWSEDYPDNTKTVTFDSKQLVPYDKEGDEKWMLTFSTTAYSDNTNRTSIEDIYVQEIKAGWLKSSGFVGTGGKFTLASGVTDGNKLDIKLDNSSQYYTIVLDAGVNLVGEVIAADMESKIRAIPDGDDWSESDDDYKLTYVNCSVEYSNGRFRIISGSVSPYYTGSDRSSVKVAAVSGDGCYDTLGFNLSIDSQTVAGTTISEALVGSTYTAGTTPLTLKADISVSAGDCLLITDGSNSDYFTALSGTGGVSVVVATTSGNSYDGISHSYTEDESKVQILREQDPEQVPVAYYDIVDSIVRWGIKSLVNQIDFSS